MAFTYGDGGGVAKIRTEDSAQGVTSILVRNAKQDAQTLLENVDYDMYKASRYVTKLPSKLTLQLYHSRLADSYEGRFRINMNILLNDKCGLDYQPELFCPSEDPNTRLSSLGPAPEILTMDTGFHRYFLSPDT